MMLPCKLCGHDAYWHSFTGGMDCCCRMCLESICPPWMSPIALATMNERVASGAELDLTSAQIVWDEFRIPPDAAH